MNTRTLPSFSCCRPGRSPGVLSILSVLLALASLSAPARAGSVPTGFASNHLAGVTIQDSEAGAWNVNLSGYLSFDESTGQLSMPAANTALGANCSWTTVQVRNPLTGATETKDAIAWHTSERVNAADATSPWRSTLVFYATGNVDPFMSYAFSAKNNTGAAQTFTFSYGEAIIPPVNGAYQLYADIAGSLTNVGAGTTAKITPTAPDGDGDWLSEIQVLKLSADNGLTFANAGVDVGPAFETTTATGTQLYGQFSDTLTGSTLTPWNYWMIETSFTLSPGKDAAALSGYVEITPIPEPATYAAILGVAALGVARMRRRVCGVAV